MRAFEFLKVVLYFLLLTGVVNTQLRMNRFLTALVVLTLTSNLLAVLNYHGYIEIESLKVMMENDFDELTGEHNAIPRMRATGIFNDPNDLSLIIAASLVLCAAVALTPRLGVWRVLSLPAAGFLFYSLRLTQSRGGLVAMAIGIGAFLYARYGWKVAATAAMVLSPLLLLTIDGRQADFSGAMSGGTGHGRVEIWRDWFEMLKHNPLTGRGCGSGPDDAGGYVAHNSYIHAFGELGLLGGTSFIATIFVAFLALTRVLQHRDFKVREDGQYLVPVFVGILAAYASGLMSLSRLYVVPTYLIIGLAAATAAIARRRFNLRPIAFDGQLCGRIAVVSFSAIVGFYVIIRVAG